MFPRTLRTQSWQDSWKYSDKKLQLFRLISEKDDKISVSIGIFFLSKCSSWQVERSFDNCLEKNSKIVLKFFFQFPRTIKKRICFKKQNSFILMCQKDTKKTSNVFHQNVAVSNQIYTFFLRNFYWRRRK